MFASTTLPALRPGNQIRFIGQKRVRKHGFDVIRTDSLISRLLGLRFISRRRTPDGIYIENTNRFRTHGMRFDVDLLFIDKDHNPVIAVRQVDPGHRVRVPEAAHLVVLPSDWDVEKWTGNVEEDGQ